MSSPMSSVNKLSLPSLKNQTPIEIVHDVSILNSLLNFVEIMKFNKSKDISSIDNLNEIIEKFNLNENLKNMLKNSEVFKYVFENLLSNVDNIEIQSLCEFMEFPNTDINLIIQLIFGPEFIGQEKYFQFKLINKAHSSYFNSPKETQYFLLINHKNVLFYDFMHNCLTCINLEKNEFSHYNITEDFKDYTTHLEKYDDNGHVNVFENWKKERDFEKADRLNIFLTSEDRTKEFVNWMKNDKVQEAQYLIVLYYKTGEKRVLINWEKDDKVESADEFTHYLPDFITIYSKFELTNKEVTSSKKMIIKDGEFFKAFMNFKAATNNNIENFKADVATYYLEDRTYFVLTNLKATIDVIEADIGELFTCDGQKYRTFYDYKKCRNELATFTEKVDHDIDEETFDIPNLDI